MMEMMEHITNKDEWERKVFDEKIIAEWRKEALAKELDDGDTYMSEKMFDYVSGDGRVNGLSCVVDGNCR
jgi:hypothetical protein